MRAVRERRAFTVSEVARELRVSDISIRRLVYSGQLRAKKIGTAVRIFADDLDRYLDDRDAVPTVVADRSDGDAA